MKILVLSGGDSPEREVSIRSGKAVSDALISAGFEVKNYDPINGDEGLLEIIKTVDMVFPVLHGKNGEDGVMQEKLERMGIKFLGSDSESSRISFFKDETHKILESASILMPMHAVVTKAELSHKLFTKPYVLKPLDGGSSVDTQIIRTVDEKSQKKAADLLKIHNRMIIEELIEGQEITVPILGNEALPVIAIVPPEGQEFDFENKYNGATLEICPAPVELVSIDKQKEAQRLSQKVHRTLKARHLSRVDIIVKDSGELYVLELNTMPGMTTQSLYPNSANVAGYNMQELVSRFVSLVSET